MKNNDKELIKLLEDSFKNGVMAKGYLEVVRSIQQRKAKLVVVGKDVNNKDMVLEIKRLCNTHETPLVVMLDRSVLGKIAELNIPTGFVSVKISGFNKTDFNNYINFVAKAKSQ